MLDLVRRQVALEKTLAKYKGRPLDFVKADCVRMARFHLLQMGHKPPPLPQYRSAAGAVRALRQAGGIEAVLDAILPRIAPARMLSGDIAIVEGDGGDAVMIADMFKFWGWHQDSDELVSMTVPVIKAAWRA